MKPKRWRLWTAALYGAAFGLVRIFLPIDAPAPTPAAQIGEYVGLVIGGAILFVIVAGVRNMIVKAPPF